MSQSPDEDLKARYEVLKQKHEKLIEQNAQLVRKNNEDIAEISKLQKQLVEAKEYCEGHNKTLKELATKLQTENEKLTADNSSLHSQLEDLQSEYDDLEDTKEDYYEQVCDWQEKHNNDCITINQLNTAYDVLVDKYHKLREIHGISVI
jgi:chromosome segregation ATPase